MNNGLIELLTGIESFKLAQCLFPPYTGSKPYTYKTLLYVQEGDYAVVETPSNGFQVVKVVEVVLPKDLWESSIELQDSIYYKWLVQKVDLKQYRETLEMEQGHINLLKANSKSRL